MHDTPPAAQEGITISPPIFYDDDVLQVSYSYEEDHIQHDPVIEIESQEILDPDPYPFLIRSLNPDGLKSFLMQLEVVLEIQKTEEEQGPSIRMNMLHHLSQILSLQSGVTKFQVNAT